MKKSGCNCNNYWKKLNTQCTALVLDTLFWKKLFIIYAVLIFWLTFVSLNDALSFDDWILVEFANWLKLYEWLLWLFIFDEEININQSEKVGNEQTVRDLYSGKEISRYWKKYRWKHSLSENISRCKEKMASAIDIRYNYYRKMSTFLLKFCCYWTSFFFLSSFHIEYPHLIDLRVFAFCGIDVSRR